MKGIIEPTESEVRQAWMHLFDPPLMPPDQAFIARCEEMAQIGLSLQQLREECIRRGFIAQPLDVYLTDACSSSGVSLQAICEYVSRNSRNIWATLARLAGVPANHILLMLRLWFVWQDRSVRSRGIISKSEGSISIPPLETPPDKLEIFLKQVEAGYPHARKARLQKLITEAGV